MSEEVRCRFAVRYPAAEEGKWDFRTVWLSSWDSSGGLPTGQPPMAGDLVVLSADRGDPEVMGGPVFRVVERMWAYPEYGSAAWPRGTSRPASGPSLEIVVEPAAGLYRDEAGEPGE